MGALVSSVIGVDIAGMLPASISSSRSSRSMVSHGPEAAPSRLMKLQPGQVQYRRLLHAPATFPRNDCAQPSQIGKPMPAAWDGNSDTFFDDFRQLSDIASFVKQLSTTHPELVTLREIGSSWHGRPLVVMEITSRSAGDPSPEDKPCIFIDGGIHAREWIAPATVMYIAAALAREAGTSRVAKLLTEFVFAIQVVVNPDGYAYTWEQNRMWRKTLSNRTDYRCSRHGSERSLPSGVAGVDANRNWGYKWGVTEEQDYAKDLRDPCTSVFIGPQAFSEPEVAAIADYMRQRQMRSLRLATRSPAGFTAGPGYVAAFLDYHSFAQVLLPPWAVTAETPAAPDGSYQTSLTSAMTAAFKQISQRRWEAGADVFPADPGTGPDWAYGALGVRATMTIELEGTFDNLNFGFCAPGSAIRPTGEEQWAGLLSLAQYLLSAGSAPSAQIGIFADAFAQTVTPPSASQTFEWQTVVFPIVLLTVALACLILFVGAYRRKLQRPTIPSSVCPDSDEIEFEATTLPR